MDTACAELVPIHDEQMSDDYFRGLYIPNLVG